MIGTASERNHGFLDQLGVVPVTYGPAPADRIAPLAPHGGDVVLDPAGKGSLAELVAIAGHAHGKIVITVPRHGGRIGPQSLDEAAPAARCPPTTVHRLLDYSGSW